MKNVLAVVFLCLPAFGQAAYSGLGLYSGSATYAASTGSGCAAPNFCAYTGTDVIPWGTVPNLGGAINNDATAYDTSYVGHGGFSSINLSPVTRLTDSVSAAGRTNINFTAGMGGSGVFTLTNTNTTLVRVDQSSLGMICVFAPSGTNQGRCGTPPSGWGGTAPASGIFITTGQLSGGTCTSNCPVNDFGSLSFSLTDPTVLYTFGNDAYDISTATTVTPYTINPTTGVYSVGSTLVDFQYGLPLGSNAPNWTANTSYPYGAYVTHPLNAPGTGNPEYLAYTISTAYNPGDIVVPGGLGTCMYRAIVAGTTNGTLATSFSGGAPCKNDIVKEAAPSTLQWRGTNSTAQFIYQNTGTAGTSAGSAFQWVATPSAIATDGSIALGSAVLSSLSNPFTSSQIGQAISVSGAGNGAGTTPLYATILSYQNAGQVTLATTALSAVTASATIAFTGHPDTFSSTNADNGGIVWTNVGPSYPVANGNQLWHALGGISRDTSYSGYASKYGIAISTNSYGMAPTYSKYTADQGTGFWAVEYDEVSNIYHLLNTGTGIWTDWSCSSGSGYDCPSGTWTSTAVGTLTAISNPFETGQSCPYYIHNLKLSSNGLYAMVVNQASAYPVCNSLQGFQLWETTTSSFDPIESLQFTFGGMNHWAIGANKMVAFNSSGWGYTAGVFLGVYDASNAQGNYGSGTGYAPPFGVYLRPLASQSTPQTTPPGCYVTSGTTIKNPDCNLSEILDSHLSWVGDPGTDTYPVCGTSYNYATLGPAFNAWQNMETCYQTYPTYPTGYAPPASYTLPATSVGNVWQFTHTFATGTSTTFSTQFQISEYSQDANWLFWSSDWNCQNGSSTGISPAVWVSGTYVDMLAVAAVPAAPTSVCGLPWAANTTYVVGNMINPIEGTSGSAGVDDVFQAIYVGGPTGSTQPGPAAPNSYFSTSTGPTISAPGSTICDSASGASINPVPPYSTSCTTGAVWQDIGPQNQRGDVFAVNLGNQN
jgi:hypothetical protein